MAKSKYNKYIKDTLDYFRKNSKNGNVVLGAGGTKIDAIPVSAYNPNNQNSLVINKNNAVITNQIVGKAISTISMSGSFTPMVMTGMVNFKVISGNFQTTGYGSQFTWKPPSPIDLLPEWLKIAYDKNGPVRIVIDIAIKEGLNTQQIIEKASHFFYRAYTEKGFMDKEEFKVNPLLQAPNSGVKPESSEDWNVKGYKLDYETIKYKGEPLGVFIKPAVDKITGIKANIQVLDKFTASIPIDSKYIDYKYLDELCKELDGVETKYSLEIKPDEKDKIDSLSIMAALYNSNNKNPK